LLIDYEFCSGCETCVVACKKEHDFPVGKWGIRVFNDGPWQKIDGEEGGRGFNWNKIPVPSDLCDLCVDRTEKGKKPSCVHHCQAFVIQYGTIEELTKELIKKPKQVLWFPIKLLKDNKNG
jgi:anaerobic dimethyl sulfoxide reductase subunit B (iron-sulfur subunit)